MHPIDYGIIGFYFLVVVGIGFFFYRRQERVEEYFVADRKMTAGHIGLSIAATDVGGGFSIGLGGLGFTMGLAGSWLLFTGFVGALLAAGVVVPRVWKLGAVRKLLTFPQYLEERFDGRIRLVAAILSAVGYAGFVGSQILAGAKLSSAAFDISLHAAVAIMAGVIILYTCLGGLQAVVYTDTLQWIVLLCGLLFVAVPFSWIEAGGWEGMRAALPAAHFSLSNVSGKQFLMWMMAIIPIWFLAMTLYQRIFAMRSEREARRAFYFAAFLEWPIVAFVGVFLGMMGRVLYPGAEPEMGLPLVIRDVLPIGVAGVVIAAYFSAIMSTADSCLLASVGNFVNDLYQRFISPDAPRARVLALSRLLVVVVGAASVMIALLVPTVLDAILLSYSLIVCGLFAPTLGGMLWRRVSSGAALASAVVGAVTYLLLEFVPALDPFDYPIFLALPLSAVILVLATLVWPHSISGALDG